jgi:hypothetical protein
VTIPRGDVHVEVGSSRFPIFCHQNPEHRYFLSGNQSDRLGLFATDGDGNTRRLEATVLNETSIETWYNPSEIGEERVQCKIQLSEDDWKGICHQIIFVGRE